MCTLISEKPHSYTITNYTVRSYVASNGIAIATRIRGFSEIKVHIKFSVTGTVSEICFGPG